MNITDCLAINARNHPRKVAIREGELALTYGTLNQRVNRLANGLMSLRIGKGTVVAVILPSCHEHLEALFTLAKIGAVALPIDDRWGSGEIERTLNHFDVSAAIFHEGKLGIFLGLKEKACALEGPLVCTGKTVAPGIVNYEQLITQFPHSDPKSTVDENDTFLIGLSSGTTGIPKGVILSHRNMIFRWLTQIVEFGLNSLDVYLSVVPMHHGTGRSFCMSHLFVGGSVVVSGERFDPVATLEAIQNEKITTCFMVPTMYHRILQVPNLDCFEATSLRALISSGSLIHLSIRKGLLERLTPNLYNYYGSVEGGGVSILKPQDILRKSDSVGQGTFNMEIRIVDEEGHDVPLGTIGAVICRGPSTARGYYKNPEGTREYFPNGWCLMGDLAKMDEEGFLYIVGRKKDMIIRGGVNIYPPEIEEILQSHPLIYESAVIGVPDEEYGEEIAAFIVLKPGKETSRDEIIQFCKENLATYKTPKIVEFVPSLPKASSGKVLKQKLGAKHWKGTAK